VKPRDHLQALSEWVAIPSLSGDEVRFTDHMAELLRADGLRVKRIPTGDGRASLLASARPCPELLFCSHLDTVPPFLPPKLRGNTLHGRGANDAKGCLYAMRQAVLELERRGKRGAGLLFLVSEETDHAGAKAAKASKLRCQTIVVGEPTLNRFLPAQKGTLKVRYKAKGIAGHSAFPGRGRSAIHALIEELAQVLEAPLPTDPRYGANSLNVGRIQGGVADNVFAPEAEATAFFRVTMPPKVLFQLLKRWRGEHIQLEWLAGSDPQPLSVPSWGTPGEVAAFNTDAPYLKGCFQKAYLVGPGDIRLAHSPKEKISAKQLVEAIDLYIRLGEDHL